MKEAVKYEGKEFSKHFKAEHLENLEYQRIMLYQRIDGKRPTAK